MVSSSNPNGGPSGAGRRYSPGARGKIAGFFQMRDESNESFLGEILGGLTNFLVCVYILDLGPTLQAGSSTDCATFGNGTFPSHYTCEQYQSMSITFALATGLATIVMGLVGNAPFVLAPGVSYSAAFRDVATMTNPSTVLAANIVVGLITILFAATSRRTKIIHIMPEDYRLGIAAGIGGFLALIASRSMNLVPPGTTTYVTSFSYSTVLSLLGVILIAVFQSLKKEYASWAFVVAIVAVTIASVIIRTSLNIPIIPGSDVILPIAPLTSMGPSFGDFTSMDFPVFRYVVLQTVNKLFDLVGTVTALILLAVMSKLGYSKETFLNVLSESQKLLRIYLVDGMCNVLIAPWLGTSILTVFIETAAGLVAGARTGLASVITGCLFLLSCLFARPIANIIPSEASGCAILVACFYVIQGLKHVDYSRPQRAIPALMAFVLIPFTSSISVGASFSFVVLFGIYTLTPNIAKLKPQMVATFALSVLLLVVETRLVQDSVTMGAVLAGLFCFTVLASLPLHFYHESIKSRFGDSEYDPSSYKPHSHQASPASRSLTPSSSRTKPPLTAVIQSSAVADDSRFAQSTFESRVDNTA